jgi:hypothetical protein
MDDIEYPIMSEACQTMFRSSKRDQKILIEFCLYKYAKNKEHGNTVCWHCMNKTKTGCKGTAATDSLTVIINRWT